MLLLYNTLPGHCTLKLRRKHFYIKKKKKPVTLHLNYNMKIKFYDSHDKCVDAITRYYIATSVAFLIKVNLSFLPVFFLNIQRVTQHTTKAAASLRVLICCMCYGTFVWLVAQVSQD